MKTNKVVIVGTGAVGSTYAYSLINQSIADEIILIDMNEEKAMAEAMDLNHGMYYAHSSTKIRHGDYSDCHNADIICITAGASQQLDATRLDFAEKNTQIFKSIINNIMKSGFDGIFVIASNPVDTMSYVTWKLSGMPKERIIGSGTLLDTSRYCDIIGKYFNVNVQDVNGYIIGEHGDSQVACLSSTTIGTRNILDIVKSSKSMSENDLRSIAISVRDAAPKVLEGKGATFYGIGLGLSKLTKAILRDENVILPVSTYLNGEYGYHDLYIGVPSTVGKNGIKNIVEINLTDEEQKSFSESVEVIKNNINLLQL